MKKAKITAILSKQYKVIMLEGAAEGNAHKYLHASVSRIAVALPSPEEAEAVAKPDAPSTEDVVSAIQKDIGDLWD